MTNNHTETAPNPTIEPTTKPTEEPTTEPNTKPKPGNDPWEVPDPGIQVTPKA